MHHLELQLVTVHCCPLYKSTNSELCATSVDKNAVFVQKAIQFSSSFIFSQRCTIGLETKCI